MAPKISSCVTLGSGARSGTKITLRSPMDAAIPAHEDAAFPVLAQAMIWPPLLARLDHAHGTGAVLQRSGGVASIVFQERACAMPRWRASAGAKVSGVPPYRERRQFGIRTDGQQFAVSPVRLLAPGRQAPARQDTADGRVIVLDIENPSDAATRAGVPHASGIHCFTKQAFQAFNKIHVPRTLSDVTA